MGRGWRGLVTLNSQRAGDVAPLDGVGQVPHGDRAGLAEVGLDRVDVELGVSAVGTGEGLHEAGQQARVLPDVGAHGVVGGRGQADPGGVELGGEDIGAALRGGRGDLAGRPGSLLELRGGFSPAGDEDELGRLERVVEERDEGCQVAGPQVADVADDDDASCGHERRAGRGVDHRVDDVAAAVAGRVAFTAARDGVLLDGEGAVLAAEQLGDQSRRGVVA